VPYPDPIRTAGRKPFETLHIEDDEIDVVFVGVEAGLVVKADFQEWKKAFMRWLTKAFKDHGDSFVTLDGSLIEWVVGMLWPDQSYTSMYKYRVDRTSDWCEFHTARIEMFVGNDYQNTLMYCLQIQNYFFIKKCIVLNSKLTKSGQFFY
jgi:hypothetical protein